MYEELIVVIIGLVRQDEDALMNALKPAWFQTSAPQLQDTSSIDDCSFICLLIIPSMTVYQVEIK